MKVRHQRVIAGIAFVLTGIVVYGVHGALAPHDEREDVSHTTTETARDRDPLPSVQPKANVRKRAPADSMEGFKRRWRAIGDEIEDQDALARETVDTLLCGPETLKLCNYLETAGLGYATVAITREVEQLLASERAPEARALLIKASRANDQNIQHPTLEDWSYAAGHHCPAEAFESFHAELANNGCAQAALLGRNRTLARTDPEAAIRSTVKALTRDVHSMMRNQSLALLMREELPAEVDFSKLEALMPPGGTEESPLHRSPAGQGRIELYRAWAGRNADVAADHILAHPERLDEGLVTIVAEEVAHERPESSVEWIERFPEGPYFDAAASGVLPHIRGFFPQEARAIVSRIQDPDLRERGRRIIRTPVVNPETR